MLHSDKCTAGREVQMNFADKSVCLLAYNVWNEVITVHITQGGVENTVPLQEDILSIGGSCSAGIFAISL
jgi:hypothetical protein